MDDPSIERLLNYLRMFDEYGEPHVQVSDLRRLEFSPPNFNKSSREEIIVWAGSRHAGVQCRES